MTGAALGVRGGLKPPYPSIAIGTPNTLNFVEEEGEEEEKGSLNF